jgi:hypothetical protein
MTRYRDFSADAGSESADNDARERKSATRRGPQSLGENSSGCGVVGAEGSGHSSEL